MKKKDSSQSVAHIYAEYLRQVMPAVLTTCRSPKLAQYEYSVAKIVEKEINKKIAEEHGYDETKFVKLSSRDVHTPVWRGMQLLLKTKEVIKIGKTYYFASDDGVFFYKLLRDNIRFDRENVHIISKTAYAISIEAGQETSKIKSTLRSCLGSEYLFGVFVQDSTVLILLTNEAPSELIAEFMSWVRDAYHYQYSKQKK